MFFQHIYDKSLAQGSYLIGCQKTNESIVIDAKRDVDTYIDIAQQNGLRVTHIAETHIHADFLVMARPVVSYISSFDNGGFQAFMESRKQIFPKMIMAYLRVG